MLEPVLLLFALALGLVCVAKRFLQYDSARERKKTREFLKAYYEDK